MVHRVKGGWRNVGDAHFWRRLGCVEVKEKTDKHIWDNQRTSIDKTACEISVNHLKQQAKDLLKPNQPTSQKANCACGVPRKRKTSPLLD
jgi:hypothetical protein